MQQLPGDRSWRHGTGGYHYPTGAEQSVDIIGLSGLITPSLDEMVHMARELERLELRIPLMIGGATTSQMHTAVKIDPSYSGPVVYVPDASRAVGVASSLLSKERDNYVQAIKSTYEAARLRHADQQIDRNIVSLEQARANQARSIGKLPGPKYNALSWDAPDAASGSGLQLLPTHIAHKGARSTGQV